MSALAGRGGGLFPLYCAATQHGGWYRLWAWLSHDGIFAWRISNVRTPAGANHACYAHTHRTDMLHTTPATPITTTKLRRKGRSSITSHVVAPFDAGDTPLQSYNSVLTLATLQVTSTACCYTNTAPHHTTPHQLTHFEPLLRELHRSMQMPLCSTATMTSWPALRHNVQVAVTAPSKRGWQAPQEQLTPVNSSMHACLLSRSPRRVSIQQLNHVAASSLAALHFPWRRGKSSCSAIADAHLCLTDLLQ